MSNLIRIALLMVAILGLTYCDYYGEGFPVHGPLHGYPSHYGTPAIRYKKVPFPYRSGRNLGLGYYGGGYLDPYYGPDRYGPVGILGISIGFSSGYSAGRPGLLAGYLA